MRACVYARVRVLVCEPSAGGEEGSTATRGPAPVGGDGQA